MVKGSITRATILKYSLIEILLIGKTKRMLRQININKGNNGITKEDTIIGFTVNQIVSIANF